MIRRAQVQRAGGIDVDCNTGTGQPAGRTQRERASSHVDRRRRRRAVERGTRGMVDRACPEVGIDRAPAQTIRRGGQRTRTAQRAAGRRQRPDRVGERAHSERAASPQRHGCRIRQLIRRAQVQRAGGIDVD